MVEARVARPVLAPQPAMLDVSPPDETLAGRRRPSASIGAMRTYRELFGIREFRVLFTTTSLNVAAGSVGSLALGTLTYQETGSPLLAAFVMFGGPLVRLATSWFLLVARRPVATPDGHDGLRRPDGRGRRRPGDPRPADDRPPGAARRALGAALGDRRQHDGAGLRDGARGVVRLRPRDDQHRGRRDADRGVRPGRPAPADLHHQPALPGGGGHVPGRAGPGAPGHRRPPAARQRSRRPPQPGGQPAAPRVARAATGVPGAVGAQRTGRRVRGADRAVRRRRGGLPVRRHGRRHADRRRADGTRRPTPLPGPPRRAGPAAARGALAASSCWSRRSPSRARSPPSRRSATARACRSRSGWSPGPRRTSAARCSACTAWA